VNANAEVLSNTGRLKELLESVRLEHCSFSYLAQILPNLPLFMADKDRLYRKHMEKLSGIVGSEKERCLKEQGIKTVDFTVNQDALKSDKRISFSHSPSFYANGLFFKLVFGNIPGIGNLIAINVERKQLLDILLDEKASHDEFPKFFIPLACEINVLIQSVSRMLIKPGNCLLAGLKSWTISKLEPHLLDAASIHFQAQFRHKSAAQGVRL
jgi:hypothetical protein